MIEDWNWLKRHGVMPSPGGKLDQDPLFLEASDLIDAELAALKEANEEDGE